MEAVVTEGTGRVAFKDMPFAIAGKTGTAHVADANIKYGAGVYQASFVGYFPANDPQYTCIVVIRSKPYAALHYGGTLAGPVFKEVATKVYAMYVDKKSPDLFAAKKDSSTYFYTGNTADIKNIFKTLNVGYKDSATQGNWSNVFASNDQPVVKTSVIRRQVMPNVRGMGLKDALYMLENMGVKVSVKGKGKVKNQSIAPGNNIAKGMNVLLELS
jgi:cell division protein FtsI (penicillin-binding protein 3)